MYRVDRLAPGDVILVVGRSLLARAIQCSTASPYSHAALVGDGVLWQAEWHVGTAALDTYTETGWVYRPVDAPPGTVARVLAWVAAQRGRRYGLEELLLDALRFDAHVVPRVRRSLRHWTCSGLIAAAYAQAGWLLTRAPWPAPVDLAYSPRLTPIPMD
jgi:hypothetical protein